MLLQSLKVVLYGVIDANIVDLKTRALQHHGHQVFADVVDVALDRANHHGPHGLGAGFRQQWPQNGHATLHGVGGQQDLGHKQDAVPEIDPDNGHAVDQGLAQDVLGGPAPLQQDAGSLFDFLGQAIVEVVVHLGDEIFVGQFSEDNVFVFIRHGRLSLWQ